MFTIKIGSVEVTLLFFVCYIPVLVISIYHTFTIKIGSVEVGQLPSFGGKAAPLCQLFVPIS